MITSLLRIAALTFVLAACAKSEPAEHAPDAGGDGGLSDLAPAPCGGAEQTACADDLTCSFTLIASACGADDAEGFCRTSQCDVASPQCGCDGETYENTCAASAARIAVRHSGACEADEPDCVLDSVFCRALPPECDPGEVPTQEGSCYGPCVPIGECRCVDAASCPSPDSHTCSASGRCEAR